MDFSATAIEAARTTTVRDNPCFLVSSCQTVKLSRQFALGLCLYDVIGSYPDDVANKAILRNLIDHVAPRLGGHIGHEF